MKSIKTNILSVIGILCFSSNFVFGDEIVHKKFNYTKPVITALIFIGFVIIVDFVLVSAIIMKNYEMFYSPLGTWIPFSLITILTYLVGTFVNKKLKS